ncbi:hypothetical protein ACSS6W_007528 [Trichoderma asperelloides]
MALPTSANLGVMILLADSRGSGEIPSSPPTRSTDPHQVSYDLKLLPSRSTGTGLAVPVPTVITPIVICFVFKVEDLEIGWQKIACKMTDGDSKAIHISTKGEAAAAIWNKRQSWDLTQ